MHNTVWVNTSGGVIMLGLWLVPALSSHVTFHVSVLVWFTLEARVYLLYSVCRCSTTEIRLGLQEETEEKSYHVYFLSGL